MVVPGQLTELGGRNRAVSIDKQSFYSQLLYIANRRNYNPHWASHKYRERFGVWPRGLLETPQPPDPSTEGWVHSKMIAWAKQKRRVESAHRGA